MRKESLIPALTIVRFVAATAAVAATILACSGATSSTTQAPESESCSRGVTVPSTAADGLLADCNVLLGPETRLGGPRNETLLNWSADVALADWDGVGVGGDPQRVDALDLRSQGTVGHHSN